MGPIGYPETLVTTNQRVVTSQKNEDHISVLLADAMHNVAPTMPGGTNILGQTVSR